VATVTVERPAGGAHPPPQAKEGSKGPSGKGEKKPGKSEKKPDGPMVKEKVVRLRFEGEEEVGKEMEVERRYVLDIGKEK
jgi:hypothetical protein